MLLTKEDLEQAADIDPTILEVGEQNAPFLDINAPVLDNHGAKSRSTSRTTLSHLLPIGKILPLCAACWPRWRRT